VAIPFGDYLDQLLAERDWSLRHFAQKAKISHTALSFFKSGKRPVPLARIEGWAELLNLSGRNRENFFDLAALTHTPERLQKLILGAEKKTGKSLRQIAGH